MISYYENKTLCEKIESLENRLSNILAENKTKIRTPKFKLPNLPYFLWSQLQLSSVHSQPEVSAHFSINIF